MIPTAIKSALSIDADEIARAQRTFALQKEQRWRTAATTARERIAKLKKLREALLAQRDELCAAVHADFRKARAETELTEIHPTVVEINHTISHLKGWMKPRPVPTPMLLTGARSELRYEPRGQVLIISPWNYPVFLTLTPVVAAVAAGNVAMVRPSEKTPNTTAFLQKLLSSVFEEREVATFAGGVDLAASLLELPFDHFFFTGNPKIGQKVMDAASRHHASCTLELGGKSPAVVDESAKLESAAERIVWGKFINAGQTCVAPDYVLVHESKAAELVELLKKHIAKSYGATPEARKASPDLCRLVDGVAFRRVKGLIEGSAALGAKVEIGGETDADERYIAPTVLSGVKPEHPVMGEEIFGPVLPVLTYKSLDEAIAFITARDKPLALYAFSRNHANLEQLLTRTTAGGSCVNAVVLHLTNPDLPFGGVGKSGHGSYHGHHGFLTFSHERAVLVQARPSLAKIFAPPYVERMRQILALATKHLA